MNNAEISRICTETFLQVEKASGSEEEYRQNMALLLSGLLSINVRSLELGSGGDGVQKWLSVVSEILSRSLNEAYQPPSTLSISFVVAEKMPGM